MTPRFHLKIRALSEDIHKRLWCWSRSSNDPVTAASVHISARADRYGANAIPWINAIAIARASERPLVHACNDHCFRYRNSVIYKALVCNSLRGQHAPQLDLHRHSSWFLEQHAELVKVTEGVPLPDYITASGIADELHHNYSEASKNSGWSNLPVAPYVAIHVRLDDLRDRPEREGSGFRRQGFLGEARLLKLLRNASQRFPSHPLYIVTSPNPNDISRCKKMFEMAGVKGGVRASEDVDEDVWFMLNSDILVISRSTFGFIPALLHRGTSIFSSCEWDHLETLLGHGIAPTPSKRIFIFDESI